MSRLIDADALEARMYHDAFEVDSDMQRWDSGCWIRYKMFENAIREAPTIEEHKKGEWISLDDSRGKYNDYGYKCSECGEHSEYEENYCPNCGCSMKGDSDVDE